ncbi:MAG: 23S rRNA (adenine(2503)-C(2))-methyltransferase RlmN [Clostridia bacterium]|nr:23S rRNA (adenine(2503)-C(2))-methyltransferase RlmN [Clostridia bacterium]
MSVNLLDFTIDELAEVTGLSPSFRVKQLYHGIHSGLKVSEISVLPLETRARLEQFAVGVEIQKAFKSADGSEKYLYQLSDGNIIEGVFMPHAYGNTLCVSTQVGCRMGCAFCASGIGGLVRNLTAGEILGQVLAVNRYKGGGKDKREITNIVLMGSGEPLDNYDNVTKFFRLVSSPDGINISLRNISLSTCGITEKIYRLADEGYGVTLSVSLHATTDEARQEVMPIAKKYTIAQIIEAVKYYFGKTGRRIIYEYSMIKGKNIDYFDAVRLEQITKGYPSHVNLIMLNPVKEKNLTACTAKDAERFLQRLKDRKVSATIRRSFGNDVGGACGQLRRSHLNDENKAKRVTKPANAKK